MDRKVLVGHRMLSVRVDARGRECVKLGLEVPRDLAEIFGTVANAAGRTLSAELRIAMLNHVRTAAGGHIEAVEGESAAPVATV